MPTAVRRETTKRPASVSKTTSGRTRKVPLPRQIGPYRILGRLGKGGMNYVLRAVHTVLQREVALKVLPPHHRADADKYARFQAEARAGAAISHGNVNTCFDAGQDRGWAYLALELVDAGDLQQERQRRANGDKRGRLPERLAVALIRDVARGLAVVHDAGLLHRDIKPANILLGGGLSPQLADFGIAIGLHEQQRGERIGSPGYMAPEALRGEVLDGRADQYGLAVSLFELVTGQLPFKRRKADLEQDEIAIMAAPSCRCFRPSLSRELDAVLQRAMAIDPNDRYLSADDFAQALDRLLEPQHGDATPAAGQAVLPEAVALDGAVLAMGF